MQMEDVEKECHYVNPLICYFIHKLIVDKNVVLSKALAPDGKHHADGNDVYGLKKVFSMLMPDPKGGEEPVQMLSWEFMALLSTLVAMAPWYAWRCCPSSTGRNLGDIGEAENWYRAKLSWYRRRALRHRATDKLVQRMESFYRDCEGSAWQEVLAVKGVTKIRYSLCAGEDEEEEEAPDREFSD